MHATVLRAPPSLCGVHAVFSKLGLLLALVPPAIHPQRSNGLIGTETNGFSSHPGSLQCPG